MTQVFGAPWAAPCTEHADPVPTPAGELCLYCNEPVEAGDRGLIMPVSSNRGGAGWVTAPRPVHLECDLWFTLGFQFGTRSPDHGVRHPTVRAEALATLAAVNAARAGQGMGPL